MKTEKELTKCPPDSFCEGEPKILILGTYPSTHTLEGKNSNFYYANGSNRFWDLLKYSFNEESVFLDTDDKKKEFLIKHNIALWDVYEKCVREGNDDRNIESGDYNNLKRFIDEHNIDKVILNGKKAYKEFNKYKRNNPLKIKSIYVISSSGAANRYMEKRKVKWKEALTGERTI